MRGGAAGVGNEPGDLREQDDPGRVRHLADEDVAVTDLVEFVNRPYDPGDPLDHARRATDPRDQALIVRLRLVEAIRVAPVDEVWEAELRRRHRADPVARVQIGGRLALLAATRDDGAGIERRRAPDQAAELVVAQEHHVVWLIEAAGVDELPPDFDEDQADV